MYLFEPLKEHVSSYLTKDQIELLKQAYIVARDAHEGQMRSSGEPYITHPVAVSLNLAKMHLDHETLMAALLHDVIEDTSVTKDELAEIFGHTVAELVEGVSKLDKLKFDNKEEMQAENFRKMVLAMVQDIRVILIKLADRTHNMRTRSRSDPTSAAASPAKPWKFTPPSPTAWVSTTLKTNWKSSASKPCTLCVHGP